nr:tyrosine-type recombinase/integrase [Alcaligenes faecalis]
MNKSTHQGFYRSNSAAPASPDNAALAYLSSLNSSQSRATMKTFLNRVAREFGYADLEQTPWGEMHYMLVQQIINSLLERKLAPTTINTYLAALKGVARQATLLRQMEADTLIHIQSIKSVSGFRVSSGRALAKKEVRALLDVCDKQLTVRSLRDAAMLACLVGCGLRRSEVVALDLKDINFETETLRVMGKGNTERLMPIPSQLMPRLKQWIFVRGDRPGPLFVRIRRGDNLVLARLSAQAVYNTLLERHRQCRSMDHCSPHDLRRTFASVLFDNGEDIRVVQMALGHANLETTKIYDMRGEERKRKAISRLNFE